MVEETYIKEHKEGMGIISFEGDLEDIYRIRDYAKHMHDAPIACNGYDTIEESDMVDKPSHYRSGKLETIQKIEHIINGLPAKQAFCLANTLKYFDRAGLKDDAEQDLDKAQNYAYRLITGKWRHEQ